MEHVKNQQKSTEPKRKHGYKVEVFAPRKVAKTRHFYANEADEIQNNA